MKSVLFVTVFFGLIVAAGVGSAELGTIFDIQDAAYHTAQR